MLSFVKIISYTIRFHTGYADGKGPKGFRIFQDTVLENVHRSPI